MNAITQYFRGALFELKNVTWPTEKETYKLTKITILFVIFFTILFFLSDTVLSNIFTWLYSLV